MNDQSNPPQMGDNQGPPFNPEVVEDLMTKARDVADAAAAWKEAGKITDETQAEKANDFLAGARKLLKAVEDRRKTEKEPHLDAGRKVDAAFGDIKTIIDKAASMVKPILADYMREQERAAEERRREEVRKAVAEAEAAQKAAEQAQARNDVVGEAEAEKAAKEAEDARKAAEKPQSAKVGSATGGGRRTSLRTTRFAEITSINTAMLHYRDHPEMRVLLLKLANADIRAAKGEKVDLPGFAIKEERGL